MTLSLSKPLKLAFMSIYKSESGSFTNTIFAPTDSVCCVKMAFTYNLLDGSKCHSNKSGTCAYEDGMFDFDGFDMPIGNSLENNSGGTAGFVGHQDKFFLYCGSKYAEIAMVKFNRRSNRWEDHACLQWSSLEYDDDGYFESIWVTRGGKSLIFVPKKQYRHDIMGPVKLLENERFIKLSLHDGRFSGLTRREFKEQSHCRLTENIEWPNREHRRRQRANYICG